MLGLAQLITKSRVNACLCAVAGSIVPMLAPATLGLIALTKRSIDSFLVLLCALLIPLLTPVQQGAIYQFMVFIIIVTLIITLLAGNLLKYSRSWVVTLIAISIMSSVGGLVSFELVNVALIVEQIQQQMIEIATANNQTTDLIGINVGDVLALTAYGIALQVVLALMIARYWQSELLHQGAFGIEIRALRIDFRLSLALAILLIVVLFFDSISKVWQLPVILPLVISGCTLLHWYSHNKQKLSSGLFAVFYIALFVLEFSVYLVAIIAIIDSFIDCRKRWHTVN